MSKLIEKCCPTCKGLGKIYICPLCENRGYIVAVNEDCDGIVSSFCLKDCPNGCEKPKITM